jgi:ADP-ribosylglycohydrolase
MTELWQDIQDSDFEIETLQCEQEGKDAAAVHSLLENRPKNLDSADGQRAAFELLHAVRSLPIRPGYSYIEPDDLAAIKAVRSNDNVGLPTCTLSETAMEDSLLGGWLGRTCGCLLGKPVEGWHRPRLYGLLKATGNFPLRRYIRASEIPEEIAAKYHVMREEFHGWQYFADNLTDGALPDDDTNYMVTALELWARHGANFTLLDVTNFWQEAIPMEKTYTAERATFRNLRQGVVPPITAITANPYREWIGAQIRADVWGYLCPGNPERAAEFAWRDAAVSHVKNGIYGEMWSAAMNSAAFVTSNITQIIRAGLAQIPVKSRLHDAIEDVLEWYELEVDVDTAVYRVHELWNEERAHDWCHTISNAMIVAIGLLWGAGDYEQSICIAVQACFDTDCNGATVGSICGIIAGASKLPANWTSVVNNTLHTEVKGYERVLLSEMARKTQALQLREL